MRIPFALLSLAAFLLFGCAHQPEATFKPVPGMPQAETSKSAAHAASASPGNKSSSKLIVTPGGGLSGKVVRYNDAGRFVVLEFPVGHLPALQQRMFVYRNGLKVGEIKITGPQRDVDIVADLTNGEAQAGDEVRDN